jgi:5-(carboxyamino)imidazole ribonucleotide synthase
MTPLPPGAALGILGGGQLGRMLALAAAKLGFDVHIYTDEADSPAGRVAARCWVGAYTDLAALEAFADTVGAVTTEFENVPVAALEALHRRGVRVRPSAQAVAVAQDRLTEKTFFNDLGVATAPFEPVYSVDELRGALRRLGTPAILKARRLGYDGKGQVRITDPDQAKEAFAALAGQPSILEGVVAFTQEVSVLIARAADGAIAVYDPCLNHHQDGILRVTRVPAGLSPQTNEAALAIARKTAEALDYVGLLAVEMFVLSDGTVCANEMAPRVHNSGHWTVEACLTSQFEQQIRAVAGWPLAPTRRTASVEMVNLIGNEALDWAGLSADPQARLTLYGKREARPGRKMGHLTRLFPLENH